MKSLRWIPLAVLLFPAPRPACAETLGLDLGVHGGTQQSKDGSGRNFIGGGQARLHLLGSLGAEARVSYFKDTFESGGGGVTLKDLPIQLSAMLYLMRLPGAGIYVLGGAGYYRLKAEGTGAVSGYSSSENKWAAHVGAGLDLKLWKGIGLNGDIRYAFLDVKSLSEAGTAATSGRKADFWTATAGLNFKLF